MNTEKKKHEIWLNIAKLVAILAVLTDHTSGTLYSDERIKTLSFVSVTLFVLCMGVATFFSYDNSTIRLGKKVFRQIRNILVSYLVSVAVIDSVMSKCFDLRDIITHFLKFDVVGPHYYICLYLQLVIISPIVFFLVKNSSRSEGKHSTLFLLGLGILILMICAVTTNYSSIYDVMAGGGLLFGGTYLLVLYLGMVFGYYSDYIVALLEKRKNLWIIIMIICFIGVFIWGKFLCDDQLSVDRWFPFGSGKNPPSVSLLIGALIILCSVFFTVKFWENKKCLCKLIKILDYLGGHTLYIFLYHSLVLQYLKEICFNNIWVARIFFYFLMIIIPIIIEYIFLAVKKLVVKSYEYCNQ